VSEGRVTAVASIDIFRLNGRPVATGVVVVLRDRDCLTSTADAASAFLLLDPEAVEPRRLSDLLLGTDRITFGTAPDNVCRLSDPSVSQHHAVVWREEGRLWVTDLGSTNGTVVDDRRIAGQVALTPGSRLWIGRLPFVVDDACRDGRPATTASIDIRFEGVSVEIAGKLRLRDVSLTIRQGEMVGVLGPSASGKSTLLRALAGQQRIASGDIVVNGRSIVRGQPERHWFEGLVGFGRDTQEVGFVQQIDLLQPELTVREILQFAARQMGLPAAEARASADRAGELCNLGTLLERTAISGTGAMNLSGGQLKRVCVALEVLRQPRVLVLDEPTTGQDPKNTDDLMRLFRRLAQEGVTLLMSTHDLRSLAYFDKVIAVTLGHLAYFGPPEGLTRHFATDTAEDVYGLLPDREDRLAEAAALADTFRATVLHREHCGVPR
jgi:ABC transport system ATP-binding/permease protein